MWRFSLVVLHTDWLACWLTNGIVACLYCVSVFSFMMGLVICLSCQIRKITGAGNGFPTTAGERFQHASHHSTCVTHVPWCMPGSLASGFLWSQWRRNRSRHSRRMRNLQFYVSGKRSIAVHIINDVLTICCLQLDMPFAAVFMSQMAFSIFIFFHCYEIPAEWEE